MDWKTASEHYQTRLNDVLNVYRYAVSLAQLPQTQIENQLLDALNQEVDPTRRQLDRLKKGEFRIAVVGLEKAGKSTFLNAWLECDLLPAKAARCTFTTTQIYSVVDEAEQRLEVQAKTEDEFFKLIEDLTEVNAQEDLNTIKQNENTLFEVRRDGNQTIPFSRLENIKDKLNKYVADEKYAHSVLEARLYTNKLAQAEGIVFYDVPGLDSGLAKHVDEAQKMLSDCDAVILVQRFTSLREKELDIIKFTEQGDKNVTVADKLFVFLSRIDSFATSEALSKHLEEAAEDWSKRAGVSKDRIVHGSAGAFLILNALAEKQTQVDIGGIDIIESQLTRLTGISDPALLRTEGTGIPVIKDKVFHYINTERVKILQKRCDALISGILDPAHEIYRNTRRIYPENPEEAQRFEAENQRILFTEWWQTKWDQIRADLQQFYDNSMSGDENDASKPISLSKFRQRYEQLVDNEIQHLKSEALQKRDIIFAANSNPVFDRTNANFRWREVLYEDATNALISISRQLAQELQEQSFSLLDYMTELLWGSSLVKTRLIENKKAYLDLLENSLRVLFLRFARPVTEALLRGPLGSDTRSEIVNKLGVDIEIADNYYTGNEEAYRVLKRYVKYGMKLLVEPTLRETVLGITDVVESIMSDINFSEFEKDDPRQSVSFEVEHDINAFAEYLRYAIFDAAGFEAYCIQEFKSLIDNFRAKEYTWLGDAQNEWYRGNSALLAELPSNLKHQDSNLEVSERLRQLGVALKSSQNSASSLL